MSDIVNTVEEIITATAAISAGIRELLDLQDALHAGRIKASDALHAAQLFTDRIAANRAAAMKALDEKFKTP